MDPKERVWFDASTQKFAYHNQKTKGQIDAPRGIQNKKTCQYYGNTGHVEKVIFNKRDNLEDNVERLEGDMFVVR